MSTNKATNSEPNTSVEEVKRAEEDGKKDESEELKNKIIMLESKIAIDSVNIKKLKKQNNNLKRKINRMNVNYIKNKNILKSIFTKNLSNHFK